MGTGASRQKKKENPEEKKDTIFASLKASSGGGGGGGIENVFTNTLIGKSSRKDIPREIEENRPSILNEYVIVCYQPVTQGVQRGQAIRPLA